MDAASFDFRLTAASALVDAGVSREEARKAMRLVTVYARSAEGVKPSPAFLKAIDEIEASLPGFEPVRKGHGFSPRKVEGRIDIGAYEFVKSGK